MNGFTPSTMGELLAELKTADRVRTLDADVERIEADQRVATGVSYQQALRAVNAVKAALHYAPSRATAPKSTGRRIIAQGDPGFAAAERRWKAQRAHKMFIP